MEALSALAAYMPAATVKPAPTAHGARDPRAWEAAKDFEAQFTATLFQSMFDGMEQENPFGGGPGETMFRSLLVDQYGREVAKAGGIGIADDIYREILKLQEAAR
ncbi:rod-binding protein [Parvibaculum sp.]|jgi:flagellar protein FlgJ|uniref:rod-binding protein n=1 Tax=Parvibaculum sp. TaxID=2024848 RepID=UPI002A30FB58|nr:rod-binding protein [Parvibaculum sp.]